MTELVWFIAGGVLLIAGADFLVRGASRLAISVGITPLVVGLTVVAFGTSAPELAVTLRSAFEGEADVALGNVIGSNIFNILFVLGLSAVVAPLVVSHQLVRIDVPLMIGASFLVLLLSLDGRIGRFDGILLFGIVLVYTFLRARMRRKGAPPSSLEVVEEPRNEGHWAVQVLMMVVGLAMLVFGARWLVDAAVATATAWGVSKLVIGLTIVAVGTSLPEVATSLLATVRGEREIAIGNVVGSNIFNLLVVLGLGSIIAPAGIPVTTGALTFDLPVMVGVSLATIPVFFTGLTIARWEGLIFLGYYVAYTVWLILEATDHHALSEFRQAMVGFVIPITVLTVLVVAFRRRTRNATA